MCPSFPGRPDCACWLHNVIHGVCVGQTFSASMAPVYHLAGSDVHEVVNIYVHPKEDNIFMMWFLRFFLSNKRDTLLTVLQSRK